MFWGTASISCQAGHSFVVLLEDNGEPGKGADRFSIWLDTGYNVTPTTLGDGNIQFRAVVEEPSPETLALWQLLFAPEDVLFLLE